MKANITGPRAFVIAPLTGFALFLFTVFLLLGSAQTVRAHSKVVSYSHWKLGLADVSAVFQIQRRDLAGLGFDPLSGQGPDTFQKMLTGSLDVFRGEGACQRAGRVTRTGGENGWLSYRLQFSCPVPGELRLATSLLFNQAPGHLHFASVVDAAGQTHRALFTLSSQTFTLGDREQAPGFFRSVQIGLGHISGGSDHLAFLLGLLLLVHRWRPLLWVVTSFSVGHGLSLALAATGWVPIHALAVEALIAISVFMVGVESLWQIDRESRLLPAFALVGLSLFAFGSAIISGPLDALTALGVTTFFACYLALIYRTTRTAVGCGSSSGLAGRTPPSLHAGFGLAFGLLHGLGFVAAWDPLHLRAGGMLPQLAGFNVGIELAQLAAVAALLGIRFGWRASSGDRWAGSARLLCSGLLITLGTCWTVERVFL